MSAGSTPVTQEFRLENQLRVRKSPSAFEPAVALEPQARQVLIVGIIGGRGVQAELGPGIEPERPGDLRKPGRLAVDGKEREGAVLRGEIEGLPQARGKRPRPPGHRP